MAQIKEMPYRDEYAKVIENLKFDETFVLPFV